MSSKFKEKAKTRDRRQMRAREKKSTVKRDVMIGKAARRNYGDGKAK